MTRRVFNIKLNARLDKNSALFVLKTYLDHKLAWNKEIILKLITFEIILILVPMKKLHTLLSTVLLIVSCKEEVEK
jgi:hypothetical protein